MRAIVFLFTAAISACTMNPSDGTNSIKITRFRQEGTSFSFYSGFQKPERRVVKSQQAWIELWRKIGNGPPVDDAPPIPIDFEHEMVVFAAMGAQPTNGYRLIIEGAAQSAGHLVVTIRETVPGRRCRQKNLTATISTEPMDIARLPRVDAPIQFKTITVQSPCRSKVVGSSPSTT
jgi:hypothetical protein